MLQRVTVVESTIDIRLLLRLRSSGRLMAQDAIDDDFVAGLPCLLVPAAAELSWKNVSESRAEDGVVLLWDVSWDVLFPETIQLSLQRSGLVENVDGDVKTGQHTLGVSLELAGVGVITADSGEQSSRLGRLSKHSSPQGLGKVFTIRSTAVGAVPLSLHLEPGQAVTLGGASNSNQRSQ